MLGRPGAARIAVILLVRLVLPLICSGQERVRVTWPLMDFMVSSDSATGVQLFASANMLSVQGPSLEFNYLAFDPSLVRQWTAVVLHDLDSTDRSPKAARLAVIGLPLPDVQQRRAIAVGYDPKSLKGQRYFLFWGDSVSHHVWRATADAKAIRTLLDALDGMAVRSAVRPDSASTDSIFPLSRVTVRPEVVSHAKLMYPPEADRLGVEGRVWVEFVIDTLGRPDMSTTQVVFSDAPDFSRAALQYVAGVRFRPARVGLQAVKARLFVPFCFRRRP